MGAYSESSRYSGPLSTRREQRNPEHSWGFVRPSRNLGLRWSAMGALCAIRKSYRISALGLTPTFRECTLTEAQILSILSQTGTEE